MCLPINQDYPEPLKLLNILSRNSIELRNFIDLVESPTLGTSITKNDGTSNMKGDDELWWNQRKDIEGSKNFSADSVSTS